MNVAKKARVYLGPLSIAGMDVRTAAALKNLGYDAHVINFSKHLFGYEATTTSVLLRLAQSAYSLKHSRQWWLRMVGKVVCRLAAILHSLFAIFWYDKFIFYYGNTLLPGNWDLLILKWLGKPALMIYCGSDARPKYLDYSGIYEEDGSFSSTYAIQKQNRKVFRNLQRVTSYIPTTDAILSSHFHTRRFVNQFRIGFPSIPATAIEQPNHPAARAVRILHCPSHSGFKGTERITLAINNLRKRIDGIEFVLIQNLSNAEVLTQIQAADFVVDQLYSDTPMAGFATEAATYGVPAIVGGFGWEQLRKRLDKEWLPPSFLCHPAEIEAAIERMIVDVEFRQALGMAARKFIEEKWAPQIVAERLMQVLDNDIPDDWWVDSHELEFSLGAGVTEVEVKKSVKSLVDEFGPSALCLDHLPELRDQYVEFANQ